jgi:flagellar motor switch protein FliN/FliY
MQNEIFQDHDPHADLESLGAADGGLQARIDAALGMHSPNSRPGPAAVRLDPGVPDLAGMGAPPNMEMLLDVSLQVSVELGRARMTVRQVLELQNGSVIELNRAAGEAVDVYVNGHMLARGEVVVVDDKFGVRITELIVQKKSGDN